jgi:tetratricopeptide (TPR) repeat protein
MHIFPVGNIAHGAGVVLGILTATAIVMPHRRTPIAVGIGAILLLGLWGSTLGRPRINFSKSGGFAEAKWGYDALRGNRNEEAARWLGDAVVYQPKLARYWFNLGIANSRLGNMTAASAAFQRAHELEPNNEKYLEAAFEAAEQSAEESIE